MVASVKGLGAALALSSCSVADALVLESWCWLRSMAKRTDWVLLDFLRGTAFLSSSDGGKRWNGLVFRRVGDELMLGCDSFLGLGTGVGSEIFYT